MTKGSTWCLSVWPALQFVTASLYSLLLAALQNLCHDIFSALSLPAWPREVRRSAGEAGKRDILYI